MINREEDTAMAKAKLDLTKSRYENYLPACVKCKHYRPNALFDPFDSETQCALFGDIPAPFLLMDKACDKLQVEEHKAFIDVGERPLTMLERWVIDDAQMGVYPQPQE
jgi:hypothetical protein